MPDGLDKLQRWVLQGGIFRGGSLIHRKMIPAMGNFRKKSFPTLFGTMLGFGVLAAAIFFPVCLEGHHNTDVFKSKKCTFSIHSFERPDIELSALFIMPLVGIFLTPIILDVPQGYYTPPYRPPRSRF
jgi:hypothetical protein